MGRKGVFKDMGKKFNKLTIIKWTGEYLQTKPLVECLCDCGGKIITRMDSVVHNQTTSCGCSRFKNVEGQRMGNLVAIRHIGQNRNNDTIWEFQCDCGNKVEKNSSQVFALNAASHCGCQKKNPHESTKNCIYARYRSSAKERKIAFNLTKEDFFKLIFLNCYYCNQSPTIQRIVNHQHEIFYNGVDRKNNMIGYEVNNCVPCCKVCNYAKHKMSVGEFINLIENIYQNRNNLPIKVKQVLNWEHIMKDKT